MTESTESHLRAEIARLQQQWHLHEQTQHEQKQHGQKRPPSRLTLWSLGIVVSVIVVAAFFTGYLPHTRRQSMLVAEANAAGEAIPAVNVVTVARSSGKSQLVLPGNIQAVTEAPVLARAGGYIKTRDVDIGDRVVAGQLVAEIEALDFDQQVKQAKAAREQSAASLEQSNANLVQGRSNEKMSRITAERWATLSQQGVVSRQENDSYQSQYESQRANVQALEKAINVAKSNLAAADANLARLTEMQGFLKVRAPFAGVITLRNVDVGTLVTAGTTLLYRIAQTDRLRAYVNVPQSEARSVHVGQPARVSVADLPSRTFTGTVTRTSNSLDPSSRTLLTEVQVSNPDGALIPGMYGQVDLTTPRNDPPALIPGDTLVVRIDGPQVAIVQPDHTIHYQRIQLGRDYGDRIEVLSGLEAGQTIVVNPSDAVQEKRKVTPVLVK
jgi:RND family efflux transporter MFP subunit